jgi:hypothetical protein
MYWSPSSMYFQYWYNKIQELGSCRRCSAFAYVAEDLHMEVDYQYRAAMINRVHGNIASLKNIPVTSSSLLLQIFQSHVATSRGRC